MNTHTPLASSMNLRFLLPPLLLVLPFALAVAQSRAGDVSAAESALARHGVERTAEGTHIAGAVYVKLRSLVAGRDLQGSAHALALRAGLRPIATSPVSYFRAPDQRGRSGLLSLPDDRRSRALDAISALEHTVEVQYEAAVTPAVAARLLAAFSEIDYAEPIPLPAVLGAVTIPNDPLLPEQTHLQRIRAPEAWEIWKGDTGTVVGIVDAGVDMFHEDIAPNIAENPGETGTDGQGNDRRTNGLDDDSNGVIDDWRGANMNAPDDGSTPGNTKGSTHGTPVAGGAAAATDNGIGVAGPAHRCRVFPVKAQPLGQAVLTKGYAGIEYCGKRGFKVVNCSWGDVGYSRTTEVFIAYVIARYDIAIVAAAGNDVSYRAFYPAGYRGVLGVAAIDTGDRFATTWGEHVDVTAPVGLVPTENNEYHVAPAATSFSAPVAAGVLALARSRWPALSAEQAIEHLRRTADTLPPDAEKEFLTGTGRVNALRAVSVDPLSSPAILVDSLWLVDTNGFDKGSFAVGERGRIKLRVRNALGAATGVRLRVVGYGAGSNTVAIDTSWHAMPNLATGASATLSVGIPFQQLGADTNQIHLRIDIAADGGYRDFRFEAPFFFRDLPALLHFATTDVLMSVSHRMNLGFADFPANTYGLGVNYNGQSLLFEGGFIAAVNSDSVVSNVRGANPDVQDRDWAIVEPPGPANDSTATLSDAGAPAPRRIGVRLRARTVVDQRVPNAFALQTNVRNERADPIDTLRFALFCDWDLGGDGDDQTVMYRSSPGERVDFHALVTGSGLAVASGVVNSPAPGIFYAISNGGEPINLYQGFDQLKKWKTVSAGIGPTSAGPMDVSVVTGRSLGPLASGAAQSVTFVIGFGNDTATAVAGMRDMAATLTGAGSESQAVALNSLGVPQPNPTRTRLSVFVSAPSGSTLTLHDALGRMALDASSALRAEPGPISIDTSPLAPGAYFLQLRTARGVVTRGVVVR